MLHGSHDLFHDYMYIMYEFFFKSRTYEFVKDYSVVSTVEYNLNYMFKSLFLDLSEHWI